MYLLPSSSLLFITTIVQKNGDNNKNVYLRLFFPRLECDEEDEEDRDLKDLELEEECDERDDLERDEEEEEE